MPLVVGIDEAGYGPTLGPLVIGASLWEVPPQRVKSDLWELLDDAVIRASRGSHWRLVVDDSKKAYDRKKGIGTLERAVLAFAHCAQTPSDRLDRLLAAVGTPIEAPLPWYASLDVALPIDPVQSQFEGVADRLHASMQAAEVHCCGLMAQVIPETRYNERVRMTRNKAAVLIENILRIIHRAAARGRGADVVVRVDRLGGRSDYRGLLADAFPDRHLHVIEVTDAHSRYRLATADSDWFIEFAVDSDQTHMPVALASMLAKYLREVLMMQFNAYWRERMPALRPTAGYYTDAQRFLADIEPLLGGDVPPTELFVRSR